MHYYIYVQIAASGLLSSSSAFNLLKIFFLIAGASFILGEILIRQSTIYPVKIIAYFGTLWLGIIAIALSTFVIRNILLIFFHVQSFRSYSMAISLVLVFALSAYSFLNVMRKPSVKEIKIGIKKLPQELSGFTIVQLSDLHLDFLKSVTWLETIVNETNNLKPGLIVITGDLADTDLSKSDYFCNVLGRLKSKYGVFAITGNHEHFSRVDKFLEVTKKANITVLRNERVTIAGSIELAGIDDNNGRMSPQTGTDLTEALKNCNFARPVILLSHQPDIFDKAVKAGVDLQLSGHTHAGQIPPMDLIVAFYFKYSYGLYRNNSSHLYTTCGTGIWGPPMRLFSRSEIVKIILTREDNL